MEENGKIAPGYLSPSLDESAAAAFLRNVRLLIESGEEVKQILSFIAESLSRLPGNSGSAIFLPDDLRRSEFRQILAAHAGNYVPLEAPFSQYRSDDPELDISPLPTGQGVTGFHISRNITCLGAPIGTLAVISEKEPSTCLQGLLRELCLSIALLFEKKRLSDKLQHYTDRLEVLREFNELIATGADDEKLLRTIARVAAFRFTSDCALVFLLDGNSQVLQIRGVYGIPEKQLPAAVTMQQSFLGRMLRIGGIATIPNLDTQKGHGLGFLKEFGITNIHCCTIEVTQETLGAILIGHRGSFELNEEDSTLFEDMASSAAAAIANARSQRHLKTYTEKLEELVQQRTADLAIQTDRAEEASRAKSRFVANLSHEFRTPLTGIVGYASVLLDGIYGALNAKQIEALKLICRSSEHLKALIDDVLNIARIEAGKEDPHPVALELAPLLKQVYKLVIQTAMSKGVSIPPLELPDDIQKVSIFVDPRHIRQILINLLSNAIKYTPTKGVVKLAAEIASDKVKLLVHDSGVGISGEDQQRLFQQFERANEEYSREQLGTGLGLALTKHLIEINGGKIGFESTLGKGSTFWILVPLASNENAQLIAPSNEDDVKSPLTRLDGLHVLVVDDNEMTCEVLKTILAEVGAKPFICRSTEEAKLVSQAESLDAVLVDLAMPGEDGFSLIEHFRKHNNPALQKLPLIVVSACVFDSDRKKAFDIGASQFVAKPFSLRDIVDSIRELTTAAALGESPTSSP